MTAFSQFSDTPDSASPFEKAFYYTGVSEEHPHFFQRSDVRTRPFVIPSPEDQHTAIPEKTAHGVFDPILTPDMWRQEVGPAIVELLADEKRDIHVSTIPDKKGKPILDKHIIIWILVPWFYRRGVLPRR